MHQAIFNQRRIWLITKHGKESVMTPLLKDAFHVDVAVYDTDTDILGTFTGEIDRNNDPVTTIRHKCMLASDVLEEDIVIASEGSFGAHPYLFFVAADEEWIMLYDKKNNIEILARELSTSTNFNGRTVESIDDLLEFADHTLFPSHRLIIRNKEKGTEYIQKGIGDLELLKTFFHDCKSKHGGVFVETDMRAMYNPSRMKVIETCTRTLIDKMKSNCPNCQLPGFSITDAIPGLPCSSCSTPTRSTLKHISACTHCHYSEETYFPHTKQEEDPMYCDHCNP